MRFMKMVKGEKGITVHFEGDQAATSRRPTARACCRQRRANGRLIAAEKAGVEVNERGLIQVDKQQRTHGAHICDWRHRRQPMLAHKASHEGKVAAENRGGLEELFRRARAVPAVAYTDPEVAWSASPRTRRKRAASRTSRVLPSGLPARAR